MRKQKGFTLVELLVVIAIIGLLSTLAVVALGSARSKARDARRLSDIKQTQTALELYFADNGTYPVPAVSPVTMGTAGSTDVFCDIAVGFSDATTCGANTVYMGKVPANFASPVTTGYDYSSAAGLTYTIDFEIEGKAGDLSAGVHSGTPAGIL